jgi:flagellar hook-associated protein FlgK
MSDILSIGASATLLYQKSLATVSNNVANLNTEGYSRQETISRENHPAEYGVHYLGTGAFLGSVKRSYDEFVERNLRSSLNELSSHQALVNYTSRLLDTISSPSASLTPAFDRFFGTAEKLSLEPNSMPLRVDLLSSADYLAGSIRYLAQNLSDLELESARDMQAQLAEINALTTQLADVNRQLFKHSTLAKQPATVLDQRDRLLKELSAYVNIDVTELSNGQVDIRINGAGSSATLVSGDRAKALSVDWVPSRPGAQALVLDKYGDNQPLPGVSGGSLGGLATFRADVLAPLMAQLNQLAEGFVTQVNAINRNGLTLDNEAGTDLYTIQRRFTATDTANQPVSGTLVMQTRASEQEFQLSVTWLGQDKWEIVDLAAQTRQTVTAALDGNALLLDHAGLSIQFGKLPMRGEALIIRSDRPPAHGITLALTDARQFAFSERYYVDQGTGNTQALVPLLINDTRADSKQLQDVLKLETLVGRNVPISLNTSNIKPALVVPTGTTGFVVSFQPPIGSDAQLQLFTRDFNHLLGYALDSGVIDDVRKAAFDAASHYVEANLTDPEVGSFAYRGSTFFYGHRATEFTQSSALPAVAAPADGILLAAGKLELNGIALPALTAAPGAALSAELIVNWLNSPALLSQTGVSASMVTVPVTDSRGIPVTDPVSGAALMQQVVRYSGDNVQFSFGADGKPADLSLLGLSTGLYASGANKESLLVYATGSPAMETSLQVNVPAEAININRPAITETLQITFKQEGAQLYYEVQTAESVLLARRRYDPQAGIPLPGQLLRFDRTPSAGDTFNVELNNNAAGDNRNLLSLIGLRDAKIFNQQTLQEYYLSMVSTVANVKNVAAMNRETSLIIHEHAVNQKSMITGVNLDQEAADLIRFQQAYQAAAQVIQTSIKLFDTLLNTSR